jgi:hypothetical protein
MLISLTYPKVSQWHSVDSEIVFIVTELCCLLLYSQHLPVSSVQQTPNAC